MFCVDTRARFSARGGAVTAPSSSRAMAALARRGGAVATSSTASERTRLGSCLSRLRPAAAAAPCELG